MFQLLAVEHQFPRRPNYYMPYEPRTHLSVKRWYSPSESFVQIQPIEGAVSCGQTLRASVSYITKDTVSQKFYYQVCYCIKHPHGFHYLNHSWIPLLV